MTFNVFVEVNGFFGYTVFNMIIVVIVLLLLQIHNISFVVIICVYYFMGKSIACF